MIRIGIKGIKNRLMYSFLIVIAVLTLLEALLIIANFQVVSEYEKITTTLVKENHLAEDTQGLIDAYRDILNGGRSAEYEARKAEILESFEYLDTVVADKKSVIAYNGLKNVILKIIEDCDNGIKGIEANDTISAYRYYDTNLARKGFVVENTGRLMLEELRYAGELQQGVKKNQDTAAIVGIIISLIVVVTCIYYAISFSRKMSEPLVKLSRVSKNVSEGKLNSKVSNDVLLRDDEIGVMAKSFDAMVNTLREKIKELDNSRKEIISTEKKLKSKNTELEKFNKLSIGRELKMIALKKRLTELERTHGKRDS